MTSIVAGMAAMAACPGARPGASLDLASGRLSSVYGTRGNRLSSAKPRMKSAP